MRRSTGFVTFCDDIREEVGGKITLVGCYGPDMRIDSPFPVLIPRLAFSLRAYTFRQTEPFDLEVRALLTGEDLPVFETRAKIPPPPKRPDMAGAEPDENRRTVLSFQGIMGPLPFKEPGLMRIMLKLGQEEEFQAGFLKIVAGIATPPPEATSA